MRGDGSRPSLVSVACATLCFAWCVLAMTAPAAAPAVLLTRVTVRRNGAEPGLSKEEEEGLHGVTKLSLMGRTASDAGI
jgi:hypothetical protein